MRINIYGLGYVGCVTAACFAENGNMVTGIDVDRTKVEAINMGKSPIVEQGLREVIKRTVDSGMLRAKGNDIEMLDKADMSIVCVGTPSNANGSLNLTSLRRVSEEIGEYLSRINCYHVVNIRSTVVPGTVEKTVIPIVEQYSGKKAGTDFGVCMNPEFLREGTALYDFHNPPFTIIGELDEKSGKTVAKVYKEVKAPLIKTKLKVAEILKYACNGFHALKVCFANEIGNICKRSEIDSHEVMNIFCEDKKLNLSSYYLKPGFAFGGSCLPKDLRSILYQAKELDIELPLLSSILRSNEGQIKEAYSLIEKTAKKRIGILGFSFKPGTDDLRESPMVELIEKLIGKGYELSIYDQEVSMAKIFGANKKYIEKTIPHIAALMKRSVQEVTKHSDVIIIGKKTQEFENIISRIPKDRTIVDLVRIVSDFQDVNSEYHGICW